MVTTVYRTFHVPPRILPTGGAEASKSLNFTGVVDGVTDRFEVPINSGQTANVGATDFTFDLWLRPRSSAFNTRGTVSAGADYTWIGGNIFLDRDDTRAQRCFGASLADGRVAFGARNASGTPYTVVGNSGADLRDNQWHHVRLQRQQSTGALWVGVDGARVAYVASPGNSGQVNYVSGGNANAQLCVFGTEKYNQGSDLGYSGYMASVAITDSLLTPLADTTYTVPSAPLTGVLTRYRFLEQTGTSVSDDFGDSNGTISSGGVPAWSDLSPF
jgi:hypothetical protein